MYPEVEERMSTVEAALAQFIVQTNRSLHILQKEMREFKDEMKEFKDEMKEFKDEMKDFKDEMKEFKDEMKEFKDEMKEFKDEMHGYKAENTRMIRDMNKQWGELANKMGTLIEDIVMPAVRPMVLRYFQEEVNDFYIKRRVFHKKTGKRGEFDVVAVTDTRVILIEVKSTPRKPDVTELLNEQIPAFRELSPEHAKLPIVPILAALRFDDQVLQHATQNGIFAMAYREWDYMDLMNFEAVSKKMASSKNK